MTIWLYDSLIGVSSMAASQVESYVRTRNPNAPNLGQLYVDIARIFDIKAHYPAGMMVHETNFLQFTGDVPPHYHNPAGMMVGGQFAQFQNWYAGVHAHYERLSQYIYPSCPNNECGKYDPGHSTSHWQYHHLIFRRGRADRFIDVSSLWATDPLYAEKALNHVLAIMSMPVDAPPSLPSLAAGSWPLLVAAAGIGAFGFATKRGK